MKLSIQQSRPNRSRKGRGRIFYGYWIVVSLVVLNFIPVTLFMSCNATFMPEVADALQVPPGTVGYILSVFSLANTVLLPIYGKLFAKYDARVLCTSGVVAMAVAFTCMSFVTEAWQFISCGVILAMGCVPLLFMAPATLINRWFTKRAGTFTGIVLASTGVGGVIWNMVSGILIADIGFRMTYRVFAMVTLVSALPFTLFVLRNRPADKGLVPYGSEELAELATATYAPAENAQDVPVAADGVKVQQTDAPSNELVGLSAKEAYRTPTFKLMLLFALFLNLGMFVCAMTPSYIRTLDFAAAMPLLGATCVSCVMGAQTIAKIFWGSVADKRPTISVVCGILMGITGVLILAFFNDAPWKLYCGTSIFGFYYALSTVTMPILTRRFFGMKDYSVVFSKISMATTMGTFSGSLGWGTLINVTGSFKPMLFGVVCMLSIALVCFLIANRSARGRIFTKSE